MVKVECGRFKLEGDIVGVLALIVAICGVTLYRRSINDVISSLAARIGTSRSEE